ncbi:MAG: rod shape-determining protein, partial [Oscillospiraceae bacterium]
PTNATEVESMAVIDAAHFAGARKVYLIEEPLAAAIGCGINISKPEGNLIIDIGGGTADIAVISLCSKVVSKSVRLGGNFLSDKIKKYVQKKYNILLGDKMAEKLKKAVASANVNAEEEEFRARGRNLINGLPEFITVKRSDLSDVTASWADNLYDAIKNVLENTPPELTGDIFNNGAILTGGGCLVDGLASYLENRLGFNVKVSENPIECVAIGTGNSFKYIGSLREGFFSQSSFDEKSY